MSLGHELGFAFGDDHMPAEKNASVRLDRTETLDLQDELVEWESLVEINMGRSTEVRTVVVERPDQLRNSRTCRATYLYSY